MCYWYVPKVILVKRKLIVSLLNNTSFEVHVKNRYNTHPLSLISSFRSVMNYSELMTFCAKP